MSNPASDSEELTPEGLKTLVAEAIDGVAMLPRHVADAMSDAALTAISVRLGCESVSELIATVYWNEIDKDVLARLRKDLDDLTALRSTVAAQAEALDRATLTLRKAREAKNGTARGLDGEELFGFVLAHDDYLEMHVTLNDPALSLREPPPAEE